jgi:hypothetical protein
MVFDCGGNKKNNWSDVMITSYSRGHRIYFKNNKWLYLDNNESAKNERPCKKCGKMPTKDGYDACLGYIKNAVSVCCGHGVTEPILKERYDAKN